MSFDIDITIVAIFLLTTLIIGLGHGRRVTNIKEYALGNRNFSTGALVATLVASYASGSAFFSDLERTYVDGLYYMIPTLAWPLGFLLLGCVFVPRMGEFLGTTSIAEAMGNLYGRKVRIITAVTGIFSAAGYIAVQFQVFGSIVSYFLGLSTFEGIVISAIIVTLYSSLGGIKAVTFTDIVQFITFGIAIPVIGVMIWNHAYFKGFSFDNVTHNENFSISHIFDTSNPGFWPMVTLFLYFAIPGGIAPGLFQRISMGKDVQQVRRAFLICSGILLIITIATQWIPFLLYNIDDSLDSKNLLSHMISEYSFTGFKGIVVAGVLALAMSSADSAINACSILFAHDICKPLKIGVDRELLISKYFSLFLGTGGVFFANNAQDILSIILTASSFYTPIVGPPMMLAILGFRTSKKSALIGIFSGGITVLLWDLSSIVANPVIVAMFVNIFCLMSSHYLLKQKGGWVGSKKINSTEATLVDEVTRTEKKQSRNLKLGIISFCKKHAPVDELPYIYLGVYMIIYAITTMYLTQTELSSSQENYFILVMYQSILVSGVLLIMYPIWPDIFSKETKKTVANTLWYSVIFVMLIVFSTFFAIVSHFEGLQLSVFTTNLLIVSVLTGWRASIWMILIGFYLGIVLHSFYNPLYNLDVAVGSPGFIMSYVAVLVGATLMLFLKPKQDHLEETEATITTLKSEVTHLDHELVDLSGKVAHYSQRVSDQEREIERLGSTAQKILNNVNHELRLPIGNVVNFSDMLHEALQKSDSKLKELSEAVFKSSTRVSTMILNMLDLATLTVKRVDLQKKTINFGELVEDRVRRCRKIYLQGKKIDFELSIQPEIMVALDPNYIRQMVDNIVINAISYSQDGLIKVIVKKDNNAATLIIEDQGIGIAEKDIFDIFNPFKMGSKTESKAEGRGIGLALCKSVVEAHEGRISAASNGKKGTKFTVLLPL